MTRERGNKSDFQKLLEKAVREIKDEARGRVCGSCRFCHSTLCVFPWDWEGSNLTLDIYTPEAVACKRWRARDGEAKARSTETKR